MFAIALKSQKVPRFRSLREKLLLLVVVVVVLAVAPIAVIAAWHDSTRAAYLQSERLNSSAQVLASMVSQATANKDRQEAFRIISATRRIAGASYARIELPDQSLLVEAGSGTRLLTDLSLTNGTGQFSTGILSSRTTQLLIPIIHSRHTVGTLIMLGETDSTLGIFLTSLAQSAAIALAVILAGVTLAWRLQARIMVPLTALYDRMERVRALHVYDEPVDITSNDEVGTLVAGFNSMMSDIRDRDHRIANHVMELEQQVQDRTVDLERAKNAAEDANRAKSDFLAAMSHEIRTPMNGIMVMAEMLADSSLPPRQQRFADVIANSGSSLLSIINDILDFSKSEAGKLEIEYIPTNLGAICEDVLSLFWEKARAKNVSLGAYVSPAFPHLVKADPTRLRQILSNLVNNSLKFTEQGGVLIEVALRDGVLVLSVEDTGIGIPSDKIATLFEAFTQVDQSTTRKYGGTGLGLAICKKLVHAMGGQIGVRSTVALGTTFEVTIPVEVVEQPILWPSVGDAVKTVSFKLDTASNALLKRYCEDAGLLIVEGAADIEFADTAHFLASQSSSVKVCVSDFSNTDAQNLVASGAVDTLLYRPIRQSDLRDLLATIVGGGDLRRLNTSARLGTDGEHARFAGMSVLVADDSPVNLEVVREALTKLGATIYCVKDGKAALDAASTPERTFDLVLMDGSMPVMDGFEAARLIRDAEAAQGMPRIPIFALTAHVVGAAAEAWKGAGMDGVLHKPFTLKSLASVLGKSFDPNKTGLDSVPQNQSGAVQTELLDLATLEALQAMTGGDPSFIANLSKLYRDNGSDSILKLDAALASGDADATAKAAHALKSMSYNMGAAAVALLADEIEVNARAGECCDPERLNRLKTQFSVTLDALDAYPDGASRRDVA